MLQLILWIFSSFLCMYSAASWNLSILLKTKETCLHPNLVCDNTKCINQSNLCDGINDCMDGSDESLEVCGIKVTCGDSFFHCKSEKYGTSGECIKHSFRCDGKVDCHDGSDEIDCPLIPMCEGFTCFSGQCLLSSRVCNGVNDCALGEDEKDCKFECKTGLFRCGELHECINETKVCNNVNDCENGADEPEICSINECHSKRKRCSHNCHDKPIGYECSCYHGYELMPDLHHCQDVNECLITESCSQLCYNLEGSFNCACKDGYKLHGRSHCKAIGEKMFFLVSERKKMIKIVPGVTSPPETIITNIQNVGGISYLSVLGFVFWSDTSKHQILRMSFYHPNDAPEVIIKNIVFPEGLAVDWITYKLYWTGGSSKQIEVSELNGDHRIVLISTGLNNPRSIALDPRDGNRYLYWCDWGNQAKIERISLDGDSSTRKVIHVCGNCRPNGLVIDFTTDRFFWFDDVRRSVESIHINGEDHKVFNIHHNPLSIAVFEDFAYWVGWEQKKIYWINKLNNKRGLLDSTLLFNPDHILAFHERMQPAVVLPQGNVYCSHLKLLSHKYGYRCVCPQSVVLLTDGKTCNTTDAVKCHADFCYHGGVCYDDINGVKVFPRCHCPMEYNGTRCEMRIDILYPMFTNGRIVQYKCMKNYCYNKGACVEFSSQVHLLKPKCRCTRGYYGKRCEFYYGYMLKPIEKESPELLETFCEETDIPGYAVNVAACVLAVLLVISLSAIFIIIRLLRNMPRYDIVVNPIYIPTAEDTANARVIINVPKM